MLISTLSLYRLHAEKFFDLFTLFLQVTDSKLECFDSNKLVINFYVTFKYNFVVLYIYIYIYEAFHVKPGTFETSSFLFIF